MRLDPRLRVIYASAGTNHTIPEASLMSDHRAHIQIINHNIRPTVDPVVLTRRNSYIIYALSKLMDIDLADVLYSEIVTCITNIWKPKAKRGPIPFKNPFVIGSMIYCMLKKQGVPLTQGEKKVLKEILEKVEESFGINCIIY